MTDDKSPIRDPRISNLDVIQVWNEESGTFDAAHTENISRSGLFIITYNPLPVGSEVKFKFTLISEKPTGEGIELKSVDAKGVVVRMIKREEEEPGINPGMGVQFTDLPEDAKQTIETIIESELEPTPPVLE